MNAYELIDLFNRNAVELTIDEDKLKFKAPKGFMTEEILEQFRKHKLGIIAILKGEDGKETTIAPRPAGATCITSSAQQRLWFLDQFEPGNAFYNIPAAVRLIGRLGEAALAGTFNEIVRRHEVLRTTFSAIDGHPVQVIASALTLSLPLTDLTDLPLAEREAGALRLAQNEATTPFDLATGPLIRIHLLRLAKEEHILLVTIHHIVSDGWSMGVLVNELAALYSAYVHDQPSPLPELAIQYADFAHWQRQWLSGEVLGTQLAYWKQALTGAPSLLNLPTDHPRPAAQTYRGAVHGFEVAPGVTTALHAISREAQATLFMTLAAAFNALLWRSGAQDDICIGTPLANRNRAEVESLIGFFVNTLVLRTRIDGQASFASLLGQVRETALAAYAHQDVPFEQLVEVLQVERHLSHAPLFQVAFVLQNIPRSRLELPNLTLQHVDAGNATSKYDLTLNVIEADERLYCSFEYSSDLFDSATIERMGRHFCRLLESITTLPAAPLSGLPMLDEAERHQLLMEFNDTAADYPQLATIHQLFEQQVTSTPDVLAVAFEGQSLNYAELNARANQLAHYLRHQGVGPEVLVGVCVERSLEMIVGLLGILKAGGAYVPLDPTYPADRLAYMLDDAKPAMVLTQSRLRAVLPENVSAFCLDSQWGDVASQPEDSPASHVTSANLAYVIYTSGSTGRPKGTLLQHQGLCNLVTVQRNAFSIRPGKAILQFASINFDASTWEIFMAMANGATLHLATSDDLMPGDRLQQSLQQREISTVTLPPVALNLLQADALPKLETIVVAGEACPQPLMAQWAKGRQFFNAYGPTETTVCASFHLCDALHAGNPPIGRPIANTRIYLLDTAFNPVPVGVTGELYIAGAGLARGYLNRSDLTAERFVPDPFSAAAGERMYRSGDLARYRLDGEIEYLGRVDDQVKIRGFRIELGEIEAALAACPGVREVAVLARDAHGDKQLVAYYVPTDAEPVSDAAQLRSKLMQLLPDYMVPAAFVLLESMPLTPSGKVDRKALPAPDIATAQFEYVAPRNDLEIVLAGIWAEVLKLDQVGIHDNFFALGGHSLLATQVVSKIRTVCRIDLPLRSLFEDPTIAALATRIGDLADATVLPPIAPVARSAPLPLSFAQQRLWFLDQFESGSAFYNMPAAVRLSGHLDEAALLRTFNEIVRRHEVLRTTFTATDGHPVQVIAPTLTLSFPLIDLSDLPHAEREAKALWLAQDEANTPFDLETGPLIRTSYLRLANEEHILLVTLHHIVSDGWSMGVLVNELAALYGAYVRQQPSPLPELPIQYADYAHWQRQWLSGEVIGVQLDYWKQALTGAPSLLNLPTDRPRPALQTYHGAVHSFMMSHETTTALHALNEKAQATLFMTLTAAFSILLSRYSSQDDICIGTAIANRKHAEIEDLIGFFVNTLVLRTQVDSDLDFNALLQQVRATTLNAYAHQDVPFEQLVETLNPVRQLSHAPLFQVMLVLQNVPINALNLPGLTLQMVDAGSAISKFDLTLNVGEVEGQLFAGFEYNTDLFDHSTIERMAGHFKTLLEAIVADPLTRIADLPLLGEHERAQLLAWNATAADYQQEQTLQQLFEAQVEKTPDHMALVFENTELTYAELNARSNRLAHYLQSAGVGAGVGADVLVGICMERSVDMIVALLGILKAGGGYLPLDPSYPEKRLAYMVKHSALTLLLTQSPLEEMARRLAPEGQALTVETIDGGAFQAQLQNCPESNPAYGEETNSSNLAYVIYTSGSTGLPKGIAIEQRSVINLIYSLKDTVYKDVIDLNRWRVGLNASISFDASVQQIGMLVFGCTLHVIPQALRMDMQALARAIGTYQLDAFDTTPSQIAALLPLMDQLPRRILVGGEAIGPDLWRQLADYPASRAFNMYGPTETTVDVVIGEISGGTPRLGQAIGNAQIYLLDQNLNLVPQGVTGELHIGGAGLARGYLNRSDLTAEKFIPNPFGTVLGARIYKSGDLARYLPDGNIEYLGRIDHQVKIRGFRMELGEIEAALAALPEVRDVVVLAREDAPGDKRLVAYLVSHDAHALDAATVRTNMLQTLPEYMVPSAFVLLDTIPLTANGKVDRKSLPEPDLQHSGKRHVAPRTAAEAALVDIWSAVLKRERIGIHDHFFEMGGHSLLATQVISKVRSHLQVELPLRSLFEAPTPEAFALHVERAQREQTQPTVALIETADRTGDLPLSFAQQRLWFIDQFDPGNAIYNIPAAMRLSGKLDVTALTRSMNEIVRRHESLRTTFAMRNGMPVQVIAAHLELALSITDLSDLPHAEREAKASWLAQNEAQTPFDLACGPLIRIGLIQLDATDFIFLLTVHHIVSDGWSMGVLVNEVASLYGAFVRNEPSNLPALPIQYSDFAHWQRQRLSGEVLQQQLDYWQAQLAGAPALLELPGDRPRPAVQTYRGARHAFAISRETTSALHALNERTQTTLFMSLTAAFSVLLSRYSGQDDICIGTAIANRNRAEIEELIGFFVNTLVLRTQVDPNLTFDSLLQNVRATTLNAYAHQDVPFEQLVGVLNPVRQLSHAPLFQVMLVLQNVPTRDLALPGLTLLPVETNSTIAKFDLTLHAGEEDGQLLATFEYNTDLFNQGTIERMAGHFTQLLQAIANNPSSPIADLPMQSAQERHQLVVQWNETDLDYPKTQAIHQLFEAQVEKTPDATAVVFENSALTYAVLNARANRLAHYLRSIGVTPDALVGLCVERSIDMVVGMLAILKAGAAYLPLDPAYPEDRLAFMLDDAKPVVLLTQQRYLDLLTVHGMPLFCLDAPENALSVYSADNPDNSTLSDNLAYVIYTSGSTGKPKGVGISHQAVNRLVFDTIYVPLQNDDKVAQAANSSFDATTFEVWGSLLHGCQLHVIPYAAILSPLEFARQIREKEITALFITTALFNQFAHFAPDAFSGVRHVLFGGEAVDPRSVQKILQHGAPGRLLHVYGPTESTTFSSWHHVTETIDEHTSTIAIGRPLANTLFYILDANLHPVPVGIAGELYIGGDGLARGYLNRAGLTAESFIADPFSLIPGARMYKTGDLVKYLPNGDVDYVGRRDHQVKIRGFRIELGEIETALLALPEVREAIVLAREDQPGDKRLVAYVVPQDHVSGTEINAAHLRAALLATLTEYMVPSAFVLLEAMPLNANGKIDRKVLPAPDTQRSESGYAAPRTASEEALARIWAEVLNLDKVGIHDNFFELGGHSLLAVTLIERMRTAGLQSDVRALFTTPTIAQLAAALGSGGDIEVPPNLIPNGCQIITPDMLSLITLAPEEIAHIVDTVPGGAGNIQDIYPLAPLQEGILFYYQMNLQGDAYLLPTLIEFDHRRRLDDFTDALQTVIDRHDILRTAIAWEGLNEAVQVVLRHAPMCIEELSLHADEVSDGDIAGYLKQRYASGHYRLDVRKAPLIRGFVVQKEDGAWLLQILMHHLVCDHTALEVLVEEIQTILQGRADHLPTALPFRNFVAQSRLGVSLAEHEAYFRKMLSDVHEPTAPYGLLDVQGENAIDQFRSELEPTLARRLRERARSLGLSAASIMHLAWAQVLSSVSGRRDVVFGTVLFGRMQGGSGSDRVLGLFINTLPLRINIGEQGAAQSVRDMHALLSQLIRHEHAPLATAQRCSGVVAPTPLFSALLNYRHSTLPAEASAGALLAWEGIRILENSSRTNYPCTLSVDDLGEGFLLTAQVSAPIRGRLVFETMRTALENLVETLESNKETPINRVSVLPTAERERILGQWNQVQPSFLDIADTDLAVPQRAHSVVDLFEAAVLENPSQTAIQWKVLSISYGELDALANQTANGLIANGAVKGSIVALFLENPILQIAATLGALKAGCVFASINTLYPQQRIVDIVELIAPQWVISEAACVNRWTDFQQDRAGLQHVLLLDQVAVSTPGSTAGKRQTSLIAEHDKTKPDVKVLSNDPCYLYFTSGSTGKPKAVLGHTGGLAHFIQWEISCFELTAQSKVSQLTNPSFDVYLRDIFVPLCSGGTSCVPDANTVIDARALSAWIEQTGISLIHCVPSVFRVLLDGDLTPARFPALKYILLAGEALLPADANQWIKMFGERIRLLNLYGPTETTLAKFYYRLPSTPITEAFVPVGRPIPGAQAILLKDNLEPCDHGEPGEIHIRTPYRSLGYYQRPDLNQAAFIANPFTQGTDDLLYKTGDLATVLEDGNFRFLGRKDFQVKIRGMRIELGEIEAALSALPSVRDVVVLAREDAPGDKRLVAYVVTHHGQATQDASSLRAALLQTLPDYMVPSAFMLLDAMPLSPNGKIDRKALPVPDLQRNENTYVAPRSATEAALVDIWSAVLKLDRVGIHDHFFELGGHSLLATQVISKVRSLLQVELPLRTLFEAPTAETFALHLEHAQREQTRPLAPAITTTDRSGDQPLSFAQQRLWFIDQFDPGNAIYNIPAALRLNGRLDVTALARALNEIVRRHEALRTRFAVRADMPVQVIAPHLELNLPTTDLSDLPHAEREAKALWLAQNEAQTPFDLARGPLIRTSLIELDATDFIFLLTVHHIVSDGWSMGVLVNELAALYGAYVRNAPSTLSALPIQYADYAQWQRQWLSGEVLQQHVDYWQAQLSGAPALLDLPTDRPRPAVQTYRGARHAFAISRETTAALHALNERTQTTLFMSLTAAFSVLLSRYSGQDDICIGTAIANRNRTEVEDLVGFFVNTLVLRTKVDQQEGFDSVLRRVRDTTLDAYAHQDLPFEQVVEALNPERETSHAPLFQVMLVLQNVPMESLELPDLRLSMVPMERSVAKFDLTLNLLERDGQLLAALEYNTDLFDAASIERMATHFTRLLDAIGQAPTARVCDLTILSLDEREQMLVQWNDATEYPKTSTVHQLFEAQAAKSPERTAVVFEDTQLTYAELNMRANRLAHSLRQRGVGPDILVGLCVERSIEMIVGLLAILKAGGAYVPLDPAYPQDRLAYMIADAKPVLVLTQHALRERLPAGDLPVLCIDAPDTSNTLATYSSANLPNTTLPANLAYVIYTSGSTGRPKGAMLQHANVTRLFDSTADWFGFNEHDNWTLFHSYAFDFSVWEIWGALLHGGKLVVVPYTVSRAPEQFHALLAREQVTILNQTPSAFQQLLEIDQRLGDPSALSLRYVIFGGEALNHAALSPWFALHGDAKPRLINMYGITETTVHVTYLAMQAEAEAGRASSVGRPLHDLRTYILDAQFEPVPIGVAGELYVAGDGLARGYLNRNDLTADKFVPNPFGAPGSRMYRSGDLARYLPNGDIDYLGRIDQQVKIRGFRIELGEVEATLLNLAPLEQALVIAREDAPGDKRLVAYLVAREPEQAPEFTVLRDHLLATLPDYMVPSHFVYLDHMPLTTNGKIDRKALPVPDTTLNQNAYVAPRTPVEQSLVEIWADVLKLDQVGIHDNFFMLGGHSLLAVTLIERMRRSGLQTDVRALFAAPSVAGLAATVSTDATQVAIPPNGIPTPSTAITPAMLPLVQLTSQEIARIVEIVPGGADNVQDIYPLAPLQEGILFHHLMHQAGDAYLLRKLISIDTRERLDKFIHALQTVINRHDILRTAVLWEGLSQPVQVVLRNAPVEVKEVTFNKDTGSIADQLSEAYNPRHYRIDVRAAPLMHIFVTHDADNKRWLLQMLTHHLVCDHATMALLIHELQQVLNSFDDRLAPALPFRNFVAQLGVGITPQEHQDFFSDMLRDIDEPTAPYGLANVRGDGSGIVEARLEVAPALATRVRRHARTLGVSAASIMHLTWARVLATVSQRQDVVFGTVLLGRMHGADTEQVMGMFINTLPLRISINETGVTQALKNTHALLIELMRHEHASLALAQRCSGVAAPAPLFSSLFNYRHSAVPVETEISPEMLKAWEGIEVLASEERTNYPLTLSVDDWGQGFVLSAEADAAISAESVCRTMHSALENLLDALERAPDTPVSRLVALDPEEKHRILHTWNATQTCYPREHCIHQLFEQQVTRHPDAVALVCESEELTYTELNARANRLAHYLRENRVGPEVLVAICIERSVEMIVGLLGILKAGGAYLPLDPAYPQERLAYMIEDAAPALLLAQEHLLNLLPTGGLPIFCPDSHAQQLADFSTANPQHKGSAENLAYVMYTSGSTGKPKGVATTHRNTLRLVKENNYHQIDRHSRVMQFAPLAFDASTFEIWAPLLNGASVVILPPGRLSLQQIGAAIPTHRIDTLWLTAALFNQMVEQQLDDLKSARHVLAGGDVLSPAHVRQFLEAAPDSILTNGYGPTECTTFACTHPLSSRSQQSGPIAIGHPIANTQTYILDAQQEPVPTGVAGELYIAGDGLARGYLNQADLTAERFIPNPFGAQGSRMYRSGDLARYLPDGAIDFLGRIDQQVKIRGFRIELGEIEANLLSLPSIEQAVVIAREDVPGNKRLAAYLVHAEDQMPAAEDLRTYLQRSLPDHMVPTHFIFLDALPLTPNGKIDRKVLPAPHGDSHVKRAYEAPEDEIEQAVCNIWVDLLKLEKIGRHDNFFELGGHSLLAIQVTTRLRQEFEVAISLEYLFQNPSISAIAEHIVDLQLAQFDVADMQAHLEQLDIAR